MTDQKTRRFNPLTSETDMFKVLVGVVALCLLAAAIVLLARAIF